MRMMNLSEYTKNQGEVCPNKDCNDPNPDGSLEWVRPPVFINDSCQAEAKSRCTHCEIEWVEVYKIIQYRLTKTPKPLGG